MNQPRWLFKKDLFQLTLKVNLIKRLLEQLVKQEPLKLFYLKMTWKVMTRKNRMYWNNSLRPWIKYNLTHNQWTRSQCSKVKRNQCSKAKKSSQRKQKAEISRKHGRNVRKNLVNYKKWPEIIVSLAKRIQKHKMKKKNRLNLSPKPIQILTTSTQKFTPQNSTAMNWLIYQNRNHRT